MVLKCCIYADNRIFYIKFHLYYLHYNAVRPAVKQPAEGGEDGDEPCPVRGKLVYYILYVISGGLPGDWRHLPMKLMVIDGNSIINRAFYGIRMLTTRDGTPTNAVYGFVNILLKLLDEEKPDALCVTFDMRAPTFRHTAYEGYKAQRKGMPDELAAHCGGRPLRLQLRAHRGFL